MSTETRKRTEYGLQYGDGEVDSGFKDADSVAFFRDSLRGSIADGFYDAADYEPMTIVVRHIRETISTTRWSPA